MLRKSRRKVYEKFGCPPHTVKYVRSDPAVILLLLYLARGVGGVGMTVDKGGRTINIATRDAASVLGVDDIQSL